MTGNLFLLILVIGALIALRYPLVGLCLYIWLDLFSTFSLYAGDVPALPISAILAGATIFGCISQYSTIKFRFNAIIALLLIYGIWITITTSTAVFPTTAWMKWDRPIKTLVIIFFLIPILDTRMKFETAVFSIVVSVFLGSLQGTAGLLRGDASDMDGVSSSLLGSSMDRNFLSARFVAALPLVSVLSKSLLLESFKFRKHLVWATTFGLVMGIIASYSRGAALGLMALCVVWYALSPRKLFFTGVLIVGIIAGISFIPDGWFERIGGVFESSATTESSAAGRLNAWHFAWNYATSHPLFGGGFTIYLANIDPVTGVPLEIHSFLFELLAEQGFVGTLIYLVTIAVAMLQCVRLFYKFRRSTSNVWVSIYGLALAMAILGLFTCGLFINMANQVFPFYLVGLVVSLGYITKDLSADEKIARPPRRR